jgi:hypothetical protein
VVLRQSVGSLSAPSESARRQIWRPYMRKHHTRRKRRQAKMKISSHGKFSVRHKSKGGRTGSVFAKQPRASQ